MELFIGAVALIALGTSLAALEEHIRWMDSYKEAGEEDSKFHDPDNSPHSIDYHE